MRMMTGSWAGASAAVAIVASACGNVSGDFSATRMGDLSNPPAARANADADLLAACGDGELTAAGAASVRRAPYLQRVTERAAAVLWTSSGVGDASVAVTRPDGAAVATVAATSDPEAAPAGARQFQAFLEELEPGATYCYQALEAGVPIVGRTGFRTAPAAGSGAPVRFIATGDNGFAGADQDAVQAQMMTVPFDLFISTGDVGYNLGELAQFEDNVFEPAAHILRSIPFFPVAGNHDYDTDDAAAFREVFALPENGGPDGEERWFSFDWGDVHFVALDTEKYSNGQALWLEADLAANTRPWTIVYAHRPPYSSGRHGSDPTFRRLFAPILERHGVPLVFVGHDHNYERTKPVNGVTYVVTGGGGAGTRSVGSSDFTAFSEQVLHFVYVTIEGPTLTLHAIDGTGVEFDSAVITRRAGE